MLKPDMIIRSNRRSLSLTISKGGELIVRAPKRLSLNDIFIFIKQKESWIQSKQRQVVNSLNINNNLITYKEYLFFGKTYTKDYIAKVKGMQVAEQTVIFPKGIEQEKEITLALKWYKGAAEEVLKERIKYFSDLMQIDYESYTVFNSKTRWGSCDINGALKFNLRLIMLPHKVIDYVVIHELAHLLEFNHSPKFYKIIESIMPRYNECRQYLKKNNFILGLLR